MHARWCCNQWIIIVSSYNYTVNVTLSCYLQAIFSTYVRKFINFLAASLYFTILVEKEMEYLYDYKRTKGASLAPDSIQSDLTRLNWPVGSSRVQSSLVESDRI